MFSISVKLGLLSITLVLSINSNVLGLSLTFVLIVISGRSLIQIKISNGPIIDPCGTPYLTIPQLEQVLLFMSTLHVCIAVIIQNKKRIWINLCSQYGSTVSSDFRRFHKKRKFLGGEKVFMVSNRPICNQTVIFIRSAFPCTYVLPPKISVCCNGLCSMLVILVSFCIHEHTS